MRQLNVRNVDDGLWREVKLRAADEGISVGAMRNRILAAWADQKPGIIPEEARRRAHAGRGIMADIAPGVDSLAILKELRDIDRNEKKSCSSVSRPRKSECQSPPAFWTRRPCWRSSGSSRAEPWSRRPSQPARP